MATDKPTTKPKDDKISICDVMKSNTSEIIQKAESQVPLYIQMYSDYYREYLHSLDNVFGTCYISEKEFFDNLNLDKNVLKMFSEANKTFTNLMTAQIDVYGNLFKNHLQIRLDTIRTWDSFMKVMMENYAKMLAEFNKTNMTRSK